MMNYFADAKLRAHEAIVRAPMGKYPFPHLVVENFLSDSWVRMLANELPPGPVDSHFERAVYPGIGDDRHDQPPFGWRCRSMAAVGHAHAALAELLRDSAFAKAVLRRFHHVETGSVIPAHKHSVLGNLDETLTPAADYELFFDLFDDPPGYNIPPHLDNDIKLLTFVLYLSDGPESTGTQLLRCSGSLPTEHWANWDNVVDARPVAPRGGRLLAFVPSDCSAHAVRIDTDQLSRRVVRGFLCTRRGSGGFVRPFTEVAPSSVVAS
jgi:hypothetical protein